MACGGFGTLEDILSCAVCWEPYDLGARLPKALPCQHTFCMDCLDRVLDAANDNGHALCCPTCKGDLTLPGQGARSLRTNFIVRDLIEVRLSQAAEGSGHQHGDTNDGSFNDNPTEVTPPEDDPVELFCESHGSKRVVMVCKTCVLGLCFECIKTIGRSEHREHELEELVAYMDEWRREQDAIEKNLSGALSIIKEFSNITKRLLYKQKKDVDAGIDQEAERQIQNIKEWQEIEKQKSDADANIDQEAERRIQNIQEWQESEKQENDAHTKNNVDAFLERQHTLKTLAEDVRDNVVAAQRSRDVLPRLQQHAEVLHELRQMFHEYVAEPRAYVALPCPETGGSWGPLAPEEDQGSRGMENDDTAGASGPVAPAEDNATDHALD